MTRHPIPIVIWVLGVLLIACGGDSEGDAPTNTPVGTTRPTETPTQASTPVGTTRPTETPTQASSSATPSPTAGVERPTTALVDGSGTCLNVRDEPHTRGNILSAIPMGRS